MMQRMADAPLKRCPQCGSKRIERRISLPTIIAAHRTSVVRKAMTDRGLMMDNRTIDATAPPDFRLGVAHVVEGERK